MTDRYEKIRDALAMRPTPGPWSLSYDKGSTRDIFTEQGKLPVCMVRGVTYVGQEQYLANGHFIAACDPDTIRELIAERDALAAENARLREELKAENEKLREALKDADNELDWFDEEVDTCDHSVGVCMCDYWDMRRKMKAALTKENKA